MKKIWFGLMILSLAAGICSASSDRATINAGALKSELLSNGFIGDTTAGFNYAAGFFPYHDYKSLLKVASLWVGGSVDNKKHFDVSAGYVSYFGTIANEWCGDAGQVSVTIPGAISPLELQAGFTDTDSILNQGTPLGIETKLTAYQWGYAPIDKFYIINYKIRNSGIQTVDSCYAGLYHLPNVFRDAVNNSANLDFCGFDNSADPVNGGNRGLLWVTADSGQCDAGFGVIPQYLGVRLLQATAPDGSPSPLSGVSSWSGINMEPVSDANRLNPYNKYYYLSRGKLDAGEIRKVHIQKITDDSLHINLFGQVLTDVEGVWEVNDTNHLGTNYYVGGSYNPEMGLITLGTPKQDKTASVNSEECWPSDSMTLMVAITPVAQVLGIYDNPLDTGTNYYSGGSFVASNGTITLGIPYFGGAQLYVDYNYKTNNVVVTYNYYNNKILTTPWDAYTLQIDPTRVQEVEGVYWAKDSSCLGTNYFIGGSFDRSSGMITLPAPIDEDTLLTEKYPTQMYDEFWGPQDDTLLVNWMDPTKVAEILAVYDDTNMDRYPGGSYDPVTGTITLGIPFSIADYHNVWVTYRYIAVPNVWVKNFAPDIATQNMLASVGPWTMVPGDSGQAAFAVVAGNTLAELQTASDSAQYIWDNPAAIVTANSGSISGMVEKTGGRGPVPAAKVVLFGSLGTAIDSAYSDATGRYYMGNILSGSYDSLVATSSNYLPGKIDISTPILATQNIAGMDIALASEKAELSGTITRTDGTTPVSNAKIIIMGTNNDSTSSDASGFYHFAFVKTASGDSLIFRAQDCLIDTVPSPNLLQDSSVVMDHTLHSIYGWIDGKVTKVDGITPISNANVTAVSGIDTAAAISQADGSYSISGLLADTYIVKYSAQWYASDSGMGIAVMTDSTTIINQTLKQENNFTDLIWKKKSAMPGWRYGAGTCQVQGKVYVLGGRDYLGATTAVYCYDPSADTLGGEPWTVKAPMPTARYGLGATSVGDSIIYVVGGYDADSTALSVLEAYVPITDSWITGLAGMPTPRAFLGVASIADTVYAVGGFNSVFPGLDTVELYLPGSNSWVTKKALLGGPSFGRAGMGFASLDSMGVKRVYAIGGQRVDGSILQNNVKYNPIANSWTSRTSLLWLSAFSAAVSINDSLYFTGGKNLTDGYLRKVGVYNTFANNWTSLADLPLAVAFHSSASLDSVGIWVLGGKTDDTYISDDIYMGFKPGGITGLCNTTTNGPVVGALVSAIYGSKIKNTEATDNNGYYTLVGLEPGAYNVHIYKAGVMDTVISQVVVRWGRTTDIGTVTGVAGGKPGVLVSSFALHPAYPNPAKGFCNISYQIPADSRVELTVYNVLGQKVKTLVSGNSKAGNYTMKWAGDDSRGQKVANGIYIYRLQMNSGTENKTATRKLVLLK